MTSSAYIHIPFCKSKCNYCSFVSYPGCSENDKKEYIKTLLLEIENYYKDESLKTLYIGGGTPSLIETDDLQKVLQLFNFESNAELTIEVNPETVGIEYLTELKNIGFNRISVGIQSLDDEILKKIGRIHKAAKAIESVIEAKKAGFENISVDFIYGLPSQSLESFSDDLKTAVDVGVSHISLYGLKIEEGCNFFEKRPQHLADDDLQADMYLAAIEFLESQGFGHYEISNFCKPDKHSRHNLNYWEDGEYYGFGASAHGYIGGVRYSNYCKLKEYHKKYDQKEYIQALSKKERLEETIFLGFRRGEGIDVSKINQCFKIDFEKTYSAILKKYTESGHIISTEKGYRLSNEGFLLSNVILAEFI